MKISNFFFDLNKRPVIFFPYENKIISFEVEQGRLELIQRVALLNWIFIFVSIFLIVMEINPLLGAVVFGLSNGITLLYFSKNFKVSGPVKTHRHALDKKIKNIFANSLFVIFEFLALIALCCEVPKGAEFKSMLEILLYAFSIIFFAYDLFFRISHAFFKDKDI